MVDLGGYVIILTQQKDGKIKLYGSPADRPDFDEVLEINSRNLENASHQHIIQYIHQCIRSKTICLRVKRKTAGKLAPDSSLIDAFVIGSKAKEHLKQIAKGVKITPRDIAQLARILDEPDHQEPEGMETTSTTRLTTRGDFEDIELHELPVDVPDSFVGVVKTAPRYPPPNPSHLIHQSSSSTSSSHGRKEPPTPHIPSTSGDVHNLTYSMDYSDLDGVITRLLSSQLVDRDVKDVLQHPKVSKFFVVYKRLLEENNSLQIPANLQLPLSKLPARLVQEIISLLEKNSETQVTPESIITTTTHHPTSSASTTDSYNNRIVRIEKSSQEPLGATVRNEPDGSVIIGRIVKGGAAEKSGLLHEGDEILEVNGIDMKGRNVNQVCDILSEMTGTLTFLIAQRDSMIDHQAGHPPRPTIPGMRGIYIKALFDYDPDDDLYIPCRELGICFTKGDILQVIDQSDVNWWQAYRETEHETSLAGLIPSINFQMQRESLKQSILSDATNNNNNNNISNNTRGGGGGYKKNNRSSSSNNNGKKSSSSLLNCGKRSHQKRKKRKGQSYPPDEILTYEEVGLYFPRANIKRPIVLIGPTNIGRHELRQRLMMDTDRFAAAVPHTSRPRRDGEIDATDYHFISRTQFEQDIREGKFVEHGEYEKNYYGTSLSAIDAVVQSGKICVLNLHVHSISILRQGSSGARLKPYFVFVSPPTQMDKLSRLITSTTASDHHPSSHHHHHHHHHHHQHHHPHISTADLQSIIDEARDIESRYGHYFDMILTVTDIDRAYAELLREINALEREPQWIPLAWLK